jgi:hypothetical protein
MKRHIILPLGMLLLGLSVARSQTLLNSWENSPEGWTILEPAWTSAGFSTNTGVTAGTYSWELTTTNADYGTVLQGPSSTALTALLADAGQITLDVLVPVAGSFGYYQQWNLVVNQPGGLGTSNYDGGCYCQSPSIGGPESTLIFTIPAGVRAALAANPTLPSYLTFQIGGGGGAYGNEMAIYIDNLRMWEVPTYAESWEDTPDGWTILEPAWTSAGFSTNTGVTAGTYSWELTTTNADYGAVLQSPSSTALTTAMSSPGSIDLDVLVPVAGSFGYYQQWDVVVNQPGGLGSMDFADGCYCQSPAIGGPESHLVFSIPSAITTALAANPTLPTYLTFKIGGGGGAYGNEMAIYIDNLRYTPNAPPVAAPAQLWVRELFDDLPGQEIPANQVVTDDSSSVGFAAGIPWVTNPNESGTPTNTPDNCQLMAFRPGFDDDGVIHIGLPGSLDGSDGCMVQQNDGFNFTGAPANSPTFWTDGDFMTRQLAPNNFINFQAVGEYWFTVTIANSTSSLDAQYVTFPSSGAGGIGFADGDTTSADFVAVGVTGLNLYFGPTNASNPWGETNASKAIYISQGTLGQAGNPGSTNYNPLFDPDANPPEGSPPTYTQTNFTGGPYHVNAFGAATVGSVAEDGIVLLGHLKTLGGGSATLDAKYYTTVGGNANNITLDTNADGIVYDCSYAFNFGGTMTKMLLFQNGQFPFYVFGFRASTNLADVVGIDPGRIAVSPLANTFVGYPINLTNLALIAPISSFSTPPNNYTGTLNYQWYQNGLSIPGATSQNINIAAASTNDPSMPAGTDAGAYTCVATDPSGTWGSVTTGPVNITVTQLNPPVVSGVQFFEDQSSIYLTFNEPNLNGADITNHYVLNNGIVVTNAVVINGASSTLVELQTTTQPPGTKVTLTISDLTNVVGQVIATGTTETFWTGLVSTGAVSWDAWTGPAGDSVGAYFGTFLPSDPQLTIASNMTLSSFEGPSTGINLNGGDGLGTDFGDRMYGWFIPPVTTNYVFFISADDGARLSLSTNSEPTNLFVIAVETDWSGADFWTNYSTEYNSVDHRGDGTALINDATATTGWDDSVAAGSSNLSGIWVPNPATACDQNRSDQFIVAYYDSYNTQNGTTLGPPGANDSWTGPYLDEQVTTVVAPGMTNFWPKVDAHGQALISLTAGQRYFMQLEHWQNTGGYDESVTYKYAGAPDPNTSTATVLTGDNIAALVPFTPGISIAKVAGEPVITYTGVLYAGTTVNAITNQVAISSGGPSQYSPPAASPALFYRTSE